MTHLLCSAAHGRAKPQPGQGRAAGAQPLIATCCCTRAAQTAPDSVDKSKYLGPEVGTTALLHAAPHWTTGGVGVINNSEPDGDVGANLRHCGAAAPCNRAG